MKKELAQSSVPVLRKIQKTVQNHPKMANGKMTIQQKDKNKDILYLIREVRRHEMTNLNLTPIQTQLKPKVHPNLVNVVDPRPQERGSN